MIKITCMKPCVIGGRRFIIGDDVPESCIDKARLNRLVDLKLISVVEISDPPKDPPKQPNSAKNPGTGKAGKRDAK